MLAVIVLAMGFGEILGLVNDDEVFVLLGEGRIIQRFGYSWICVVVTAPWYVL